MSYPAPILNLNFANAKQLVHPALTFSRASLGSYFDGSGILRYANNSVPRFDHDPLNGICKGLLVEPAVTFLDTYSEQFDNAAWTKVRDSITADAVVAPDGTMTADKLVEDTTASNTHFIYEGVVPTAGSTYVFSVFVKSAGRTYANLQVNGAGSTTQNLAINLSTGAVLSGTGSVDAFGSDWYRISMTYVATTTSTMYACVLTHNGTTVSYTGDGTSGLYIWGAKLYAGTGTTSYLPTVASGVTRAADVCSVDLTKLTRNGSPLWTGTEGTIVVDFRLISLFNSQRIISLGSDTNNEIRVMIGANGQISILVVVAGVVVYNGVPLSTAFSANINIKLALSFSLNSMNLAALGSIGSVVTSVSIPSTNTMRLMNVAAGTTPGAGCIRSIQLYNRRIDDAYLPALSAL